MTLYADYDPDFLTVSADDRWQLMNGYLPSSLKMEPGSAIAMTHELLLHVVNYANSRQTPYEIAMMDIASHGRFLLGNETELKPAGVRRGRAYNATTTFTIEGIETEKPIWFGVLERARIEYCLCQYTYQSREYPETNYSLEEHDYNIRADKGGHSFVAMFSVTSVPSGEEYVRCIVFRNAIYKNVDSFIAERSTSNLVWKLVRTGSARKDLL